MHNKFLFVFIFGMALAGCATQPEESPGGYPGTAVPSSMP